MADLHDPNIDILIAAVTALGPLTDQMVFLGGCATGMLLTDLAAPPVRVTHDVDVITEAASLADYYKLSEQLRARGFREDAGEGAPVCRWRTKGVLLDVMPTDPTILGFGNRWYRDALNAAQWSELPGGSRIRHVSAPYFLATKLEAFDGRGAGDYVSSHDIEDLVAVLDGRPELVDEVAASQPDLRVYLADRFSALLADHRFMQALPGHLPGDAASQARRPLIERRMRAIASP